MLAVRLVAQRHLRLLPCSSARLTRPRAAPCTPSRLMATLGGLPPESDPRGLINRREPDPRGDLEPAAASDSGNIVRRPVGTTRPARVSSLIPPHAPDRPRARQYQAQPPPLVLHRSNPPPEESVEVLPLDHPQVLSRPDLLPTKENPVPFWFTAPRRDAEEEHRKAMDAVSPSSQPQPPRLHDSPYPNSRAAETLAKSPGLQLFRTRLIGLAEAKHAQPRPIRFEEAVPNIVEDSAALGQLDLEAIPEDADDDYDYPPDPEQVQAAEEAEKAFASVSAASSTVANWHPAQASDYEVRDLIDTLITQARTGQRKAVSVTHQLLKDTVSERRKRRARFLRVQEEEVPLKDLGMPFRPELFKALLVMLAFDGTSSEARAVEKDMLDLGYKPDLFDLNALLRAAARDGDELMAVQVLDQIAKVPRKQSDPPLLSVNETWGLFRRGYVANWTPDTFNSLFLLCSKRNNVEYALALVGLASQYAKAAGGYPESMGKWIPAPVRMALLQCLFRAAQPGLAYDLLQILVQAEGDQAIERDMWVELLESFSDQQYLPGISLVWKKMIATGIDPGEEVAVNVLEASCRTGETLMAERAFLHLTRIRADQNMVLREWHVVPLISTYLKAGQWEKAFLTCAMARQAGIDPGSEVTHLIQNHAGSILGNAADSDFTGNGTFQSKADRVLSQETRIDAAVAAMIEVGKYPHPKGGVDRRVLTGVLLAFSHSQNPLRAIDVLHKSKELYGAQLARRPGTPAITPSPLKLQPTIDSYNAVLIPLVKLAATAQAHKLLTDTLKDGPDSWQPGERFPLWSGNSGVLTWNAVTYERLIHMALRSNDTQQAMRLYRAARQNDIVLTYTTFLSLAMYLNQRHGTGAHALLVKMKELGLPPPKFKYLAPLGLTPSSWTQLNRPVVHYEAPGPREQYRDELY